MNKEELQKYCAELIGVSSSEKELAFDILKEKILDQLKKDGDALRVDQLGVFQLKLDEENNSAELIFTSSSKKFSSKTLFLRIPVKLSNYEEDTTVEDIFSLSVGKPIVPLKSSTESNGDNEASFIFIKKKIEERVSEILSNSEMLAGFNLWDEYLKTIPSRDEKQELRNESESLLHKLSEPEPEAEAEEDSFNKTLIANDLEFYSYPDEEKGNEIEIDDELFDDLETFKNIQQKESISSEEVMEAITSQLEIQNDKSITDEEINELEVPNEDVKEETVKPVEEPRQVFHDEELFDIDDSIFKDNDELDKVDWNWGDELEKVIPDEEEPNKKVVEAPKKVRTDKEKTKVTKEKSIDSDPFGTLEQTLASDEEFKTLTGEFRPELDSRSFDDEYRITNLSKPREVPPKHKTRFTRLTSPVDEQFNEEERLPVNNKPSTYKSFREKNSNSNLFVIAGIIVILIAIIYFAFSVSEQPSKDLIAPTNQITQEEPRGDIVTREVQAPTQVAETQTQVIPNNEVTSSGPDNTSEVEEVRISNLIFRRGNEFNVQVSSWRSAIKADDEMKRLKARGYKAFVVQAYLPAKGGTWYRVRIGGFKSVDEARNFLNNTQL